MTQSQMSEDDFINAINFFHKIQNLALQTTHIQHPLDQDTEDEESNYNLDEELSYNLAKTYGDNKENEDDHDGDEEEAKIQHYN